MIFYLRFLLLLFLIEILDIPYLYAQKIQFSYLTTKDGLPQNRVRTIMKDNYGFMWFGTWNGLCRYDGYNFKVYKNVPDDKHSIASNRIHYIYKDKQGNLWIETFHAIICLYQYKTDNFIRFKRSKLPKALRDSVHRQQNLVRINHLAQELQEKIGTFELSQTKENIVFNINPNNEGGINDNNVNCVYKDNEGILWLGTTMGGINKAELQPKPFHTHSIATSVRAIWVDSSGIWLGTQDNGVLFLNRKTGSHQTQMGLQSGKNIRALLKDSRGNLWIGSRTRLDKYNLRTKQTVSYFAEKNAEFGRFFALAEDPLDQSIWIASINGILRYDPKSDTFQKQLLNHSFSSSGAGCLFFDSQHNLWIGSEYAGLIKVKRNPLSHQIARIEVYNSDSRTIKLLDNRVYAVTEDERGNIWAGTANGLLKISPQGHSMLLGKEQGLTNTYVSKVLADRQGFIWIGHKLGLSRINIETDVIRNYTIKENTPRFELIDAAGYRDNKNGELFFGSTEGFVSFIPNQIHDNTFVPKIYFTGLEVQNKPISQGEVINDRVLLTSPITFTKQLIFKHEERSFSIEFSALQYIAPEQCQFAYKLDGIDTNWIITDAYRRVASYSNLPAGKYHLWVKNTNADGAWNSKYATIEIIILPPWWLTWWAYSLYSVFLTLLLYGILKIIKARQTYQQQLFEAKIKTEKAIEMEELKLRFFTNISHEFRTPLSLILDPLNHLMEHTTEGNEHSYYQIMHRNASRLLYLINELLTFRKLDSGTRQLSIHHQDIVLFIRQLLSAFEFRAAKRQIKLHFESDLASLPMNFDSEVLTTILYNLVSNALRFSADNGTIWICLHNSSTATIKEVIISVKDHGIGIPAQHIHQIFEPFVQITSHSQRFSEGTGLGLALTKELVELHQGTISVSSIPFVETCFTFSIKNLEEHQSTPPPLDATTIIDELSHGEETSTSSSEVILLIEDNEDIRAYLKSKLQAKYLVYEAKNGLEGFEKAKELIPDLIITDIMMPQANGFELCSKTKSDETTSHIPIIVLTAHQSHGSQLEGYALGADAFIAKPFNSALLLSRIDNLLLSRKKLRELFNSSNNFNHQFIGHSEIDEVFISKINDLVENNLLNVNLTVEWLASQLALSRTQLYRKVKALTNQSVHDFITIVRLKKATTLLKQNHNVSETAHRVGYSDSTTFSRAFQKHFGQTPKKYSQQS